MTMEIFAKFVRLGKKAGLLYLITVFLMAAAVLFSSSQVATATDLGLIDATALKGNTSKWVILDARPMGDWSAGHIPGAIQFSWDNYTRTDSKGVEYSSFPPQELAIDLAALGIDEKSPVVVYGDADKSWGSEGYDVWLLSWLGHKGPIRLLNGGIQAWRSLNLPLTRGPERPAAKKARYQVNLQPQYIISTEDIQNGKGSYTLVDVRSTFECFKGRIPGAIHIPWDDFYTGNYHRPLASAELKKLLAKHGVDTSKPVVYYCLGGVRSAYAWMTHQLAGLPVARNYKGSWAAWEKRAGQ
jgi:thiosulfate/3-mercaptopyruvate sulfurtransferase